MPLCSLDLSNAYDQCWRRGILKNLMKNKINGRMLAYSKNFMTSMTSRTIRVAIGNCYSETQVIENGVPQGAVISVTFFLIAINDITKCSNYETRIVGYADDWVIYSRSKSFQQACDQVGDCVSKIENWTERNGITISPTKTKAMVITHRRIPNPNPWEMLIRGEKVEVVPHHPILGLIFDTKLSWKIHLKEVKQKAEKKLSILKYLAGTTWG
jgi:Reverse transcriptase (RNA-dependent DNA polymerase)